MANVAGFLFSFTSFLIIADDAWARCPENYCYRVEMCIMEAQVAPQAGGGLPLITDINKLEELCERGIIQKTIDCLRDIHLRCAVFKDHFKCVSKFGPRISSCILIRTQLFKKAITEVRLRSFQTLHGITCNFAQNIVNCLEYPLVRSCPVEVVGTLVNALHRFLPPACAPVRTSNGITAELNTEDKLQ